MANLIRSAKSGNDWTENDLEAYNIQLRFEDAATFFGDSILPLPEIDEEIFTTLEADDMFHDSNAELINLLDLAMGFSEEPAVNDFAVELFKRLGYVKRNRVARTQKDISFFNSGEWRYTKADICLLDLSQDDILLLVQEDKRSLLKELRDPRPQLIAEAIAAFDRNHHLQRHVEEQTVESKACSSDKFCRCSPLICFVDHPWHRTSWYDAKLFQDPCHWQPRAPRAGRHIPAGTYRCFCLCSGSP
jgi:hypothetical protein